MNLDVKSEKKEYDTFLRVSNDDLGAVYCGLATLLDYLKSKGQSGLNIIDGLEKAKKNRREVD